MENLPVEVRDRVLVVESGCWEWQGHKNPLGYGQVRVDSKLFLVHRFVYMRVKGWFSPELVIRHSCDNPACCNPSHLSAGTQDDNVQDSVVRGKLNQGESNGRSKLTELDVTAIREAHAAGKTQAALAREFGVNRSCIWKIVHKVHWSN